MMSWCLTRSPTSDSSGASETRTGSFHWPAPKPGLGPGGPTTTRVGPTPHWRGPHLPNSPADAECRPHRPCQRSRFYFRAVLKRVQGRKHRAACFLPSNTGGQLKPGAIQATASGRGLAWHGKNRHLSRSLWSSRLSGRLPRVASSALRKPWNDQPFCPIPRSWAATRISASQATRYR